jgi:hypothetical protein
VWVQFPVGDATSTLSTISRNISLGGVLVETEAPIPEDCRVVLTMSLKGEPIVHPLRVTAEGKVVRVVSENPGFAIGIEFNKPISRIEGLLSGSGPLR